MNKKVILLSEVDWDYLWQRHQIWASFYAKNNNKTFYINKQGMRWPRLHEWGYVLRRILTLFRKKNKKIENKMDPNLSVLSPLFFPGNSWFSRFFNSLVFVPLFIRSFKTTQNLLIHVYQPTALTKMIIKRLPHAHILYDCVQNFSEHPTANKLSRNNENWLIKNADSMITDSDFLYKKHLPARPDLLQIAPGVDFSHFNLCYRGDEKKEPRRFVYYGNIRADLDFELLNKFAETNLDITLIGKTHKDVLPLISKKIKIIEQKTYAELPHFLKEYDVLLLPYTLNEFTQGIIPAKTYECFAMGKPIIATRLPSLARFEDMLFFVDAYTDIHLLLEQIKNEPEEQTNKRLALAKEHSWEERFKMFCQLRK